jgi:hypothetical protein
LPGLPLAASYGAMGLEFSLAQLARAAWRFWRAPRRWLPGPGGSTAGYLVVAEPDPYERTPTGEKAAPGCRLEGLWDV